MKTGTFSAPGVKIYKIKSKKKITKKSSKKKK